MNKEHDVSRDAFMSLCQQRDELIEALRELFDACPMSEELLRYEQAALDKAAAAIAKVQSSYSKPSWSGYNDSATMLVKRFRINICWFEVNVPSPFEPTIYMYDKDPEDLNRAIVECVAQMQRCSGLGSVRHGRDNA